MEPQMEEIQKAKKRFWRVVAPLLIYFAVRYVANALMTMFLFLTHLPELIDVTKIDQSNFVNALNYVYSSMGNALLNSETLNQLNVIVLKNTLLLTIAEAIFVIPVGLIFFILDRRQDKKTMIPRQSKEPVWKYPMMFVLGIAACLGLNIILNMCDQVFFNGSTSQVLSLTYSSSFVLQLIGLGIIVPISEELFYRGVLFNRYRENGTYMRAAIYSSLLFMLAHGTMIQMIYAMVLGMILSYAYEKFGSIAAPICIHIAVNMMSVIATKISLFSWALSKPIRAGVITIVCAFVGSTVIVCLQNMEGRDYSVPSIGGDNTTEKSDNI